MSDPIDPLRYFQGGDPDDIRFQFEIIKNLGQSVRQLTEALAEVQKSNHQILIQLAEIKAQKTDQEVAAIKVKVEALEQESQRRLGRDGFVTAFLKSPVVAWLSAAALALAALLPMVGKSK